MSTQTLEPLGTSDTMWLDDEEHVVQQQAADIALSDFDVLADELAEYSMGQGSLRESMRHPNYSEILILGDAAVPKLLRRLDEPVCRPVWLRLLADITGLRMHLGTETIEDAALAWRMLGPRSPSFAHFSH